MSSVAVLMCFNAATLANVNQGIGTAIMIFMTVEVTILQFLFFKETISLV